MIALEQARQYLETLGLRQAVEILDNTLDSAASRQLPHPDMLAELPGAEVAARRERYLTTRTRLAHLPFQRTLEQFDFAFQCLHRRAPGQGTGQPGLRPRGQQHPATGTARRGQDPPGHSLDPQGHRERLRCPLRPRPRPDGRSREGTERAQPGPADAGLPRRPRCLLVDEFGIWPHDRESATAFFTLVSARYRAGQHHPDLQTRDSASGASCWGTPSSPRLSWTGCCATAMC